MQGDNLIPGLSNNRTVLGDLTNRRLKRGVSLILGDSEFKSRDACRKNVEGEPRSVKQIGLEVENLVNKKTRENVDIRRKEIPFFGSKNKQVSGVVPTISGFGAGSASSNLVDSNFILLEDGLCIEKDDALRVLEEGGESRDEVSTCSGSRKLDKGRMSRNFVENDAVEEGLEAQGPRNVEKNVVDDQWVSRKSGSNECSRLPIAEGSRLLGLERCTGQMGDSIVGNELHKGCSCSFCLKAAYIWSDLHYQDIKGRITALKKSHKEAVILRQKSSRLKETHPCQGSSTNSKHLDIDLSSQWMTLFDRMEDIFSQEGNHLQASFGKLKDLRESCKMKLGGINETTLEEH